MPTEGSGSLPQSPPCWTTCFYNSLEQTNQTLTLVRAPFTVCWSYAAAVGFSYMLRRGGILIWLQSATSRLDDTKSFARVLCQKIVKNLDHKIPESQIMI